jgi:transcriptional regulator with XRE-family HTH domain
METFVERLKYAMECAGLPPEEHGPRILAHAMGTSRTAIVNVLKGTTKYFDAVNMFRAADVLGISARWLVLGEGRMHNDLSPDALRIARRLDELPEESRRPALALCNNAVYGLPVAKLSQAAKKEFSTTRSPEAEEIACRLDELPSDVRARAIAGCDAVIYAEGHRATRTRQGS